MSDNKFYYGNKWGNT